MQLASRGHNDEAQSEQSQHTQQQPAQLGLGNGLVMGSAVPSEGGDTVDACFAQMKESAGVAKVVKDAKKEADKAEAEKGVEETARCCTCRGAN